MTTTHYIWDEENDSYFMETDGDGNVTAVYTNEPVPYGRVISQRRGNATSFYHYDGQGSTRQLTDENGNVTDEYTYSAFGETVASSAATVNPFRFVAIGGYYWDGDYYYVRSRYLEVTLGRWSTRDPLGFADGPNLYLYVDNSPITHVDMTGLRSFCFPGMQDCIGPPPKPKDHPALSLSSFCANNPCQGSRAQCARNVSVTITDCSVSVVSLIPRTPRGCFGINEAVINGLIQAGLIPLPAAFLNLSSACPAGEACKGSQPTTTTINLSIPDFALRFSPVQSHTHISFAHDCVIQFRVRALRGTIAYESGECCFSLNAPIPPKRLPLPEGYLDELRRPTGW